MDINDFYVLSVIIFAVWQSVEICHHSQAGTIWRFIAETLHKFSLTKYLGDGMTCPYCFSNWFGILYAGIYGVWQYDIIVGLCFGFIGGLGCARGANLLNDLAHNITRTPNKNENSKSEIIKQEMGEEFPFPEDWEHPEDVTMLDD